MMSTTLVVATSMMAAGPAQAVSPQAPSQPLAESHLHLTGIAEILGSDPGRWELWADSDGRLCYHAAGPLVEAAGWDGSAAWASGVTGMPRAIRGHERVGTLLPWWGMAGFLRQAVLPGGIVADDRGADGTTHRLLLEDVTGRVAFADDGAVVTLVVDAPFGRETTRYGDWRKVGEGLVAGSMVSEIAGVEVRRIRLERAEVVPGSFACPRPTGSAARFDPSVPPDVEVRRAPTGHFLVRPEIRGREGGWFILDTGGGPGVVSSSTIVAFGLKRVGRGVVTSAEGQHPADWYVVPDLSLGPVRFEDAPMIAMDLDYLEAPLGAPIAGILGYGLFSRVVAEITAASSTVRLFPPSHDPGAANPWQDLELVDLVPVARGRFSQGEGDFRLDIGAGGPAGGVIFHSPAVKAMGLGATLAGERGDPSSPAVPTSLEWFEIGGHRFTDVPALLWKSDEGAFADPHLTGNVGLTLLGAFTMVLDYPRARFLLVPVEGRP